MNIKEYIVLKTLLENPFYNQRKLAEETGYSLGTINSTLKKMVAQGYLNKEMYPEKEIIKKVRQKRPRNAIILAAGMGMRMVPINLLVSKGLLEVNGEPLIERLIKQLREVGVSEIYIVVGFLKERYEYLIDKYQVALVVNTKYFERNNMYSLALVAEKIGNTYILPCDIWCEENPFSKNELYSWYLMTTEKSKESFVRINRKQELVAEKKEADRMIGIAYILEKDAGYLKGELLRKKDDNRYEEEFWEYSLLKNGKMIVYARTINPDKVFEINTYEQLRELDSHSNQLNSEVLKVIAEQFRCTTGDILEIKALKKGMTNRSFLFRVNNERYIMRIPGEGTDKLIDRKQEAEVYAVIRGLGFCDDPIYIAPDKGYKISKYIEDVRCCDPENENDLYLCMKKLREFHNYLHNGKPLEVPYTFDLFERIDFYESLWNGYPSVYKDYRKTKENCRKLGTFINKHHEPFQLTHIDAVPDNFLIASNVRGELSIQLTDWEYSAMQDKHVDIAMFAIYALYNKKQIDRLIDIYFEEDGGCDKITRAKLYCYVSVCGLIWSNWCEYKRNLGVEFGEYSLQQYRYAKDFFKYAIELMNEIGEALI